MLRNLGNMLLGAVLMALTAYLGYQIGYLRRHTLPVQAQYRGEMPVGFVEAPKDMDYGFGPKSFTATYELGGVFGGDDILKPTFPGTGQLVVEFAYKDKQGAKHIFHHTYAIACDPNRLYYPVHIVQEAVLFRYNWQGGMELLGFAKVVFPPILPQKHEHSDYPLHRYRSLHLPPNVHNAGIIPAR